MCYFLLLDLTNRDRATASALRCVVYMHAESKRSNDQCKRLIYGYLTAVSRLLFASRGNLSLNNNAVGTRGSDALARALRGNVVMRQLM